MRFPALSSLAALVLAGCAQTPPAPAPTGGPAPAPGNAGCNAAAAEFAIGKAATASVVEEARQRAGAHMARTLRPNQAVTMEFNGSRLNLKVDNAGRVTGVTCG